ncbi:MAG: ferredoxin family protein [Spirochaetaceae bacterium]|jgi:NAD-dependent dihydropyrimidine dehydrogenase PreA subunit|nr:ferredoxin family protein [Spirochaetaceae bacterium]
MVRNIVTIDTEKCSGCGICVSACHEGALAIQNGKAVLTRDDYCDGLGNCLPACPEGALIIEKRDTTPYAAPPPAAANWPLQLKLTQPASPRLTNADIVISADCAAFAAPFIYAKQAARKAVLIGCPKLDDIDYSEKIAEIIIQNTPRSITALRMEVPCCGGIPWFIQKALEKTKASIPFQTLTLSIHGELCEEAAQ